MWFLGHPCSTISIDVDPYYMNCRITFANIKAIVELKRSLSIMIIHLNSQDANQKLLHCCKLKIIARRISVVSVHTNSAEYTCTESAPTQLFSLLVHWRVNHVRSFWVVTYQVHSNLVYFQQLISSCLPNAEEKIQGWPVHRGKKISPSLSAHHA